MAATTLPAVLAVVLAAAVAAVLPLGRVTGYRGWTRLGCNSSINFRV